MSDEYEYIPEDEHHWRLYDTMGRVRSYAYKKENFGPTPLGWEIREHFPHQKEKENT